MLTFDTPYKGTIKQSKITNKIIIKLEDASIESPKIKKLSSEFLKSITISPRSDTTEIIANTASANVKLIASKTADGYGLRLRFTTLAAKGDRNIQKQTEDEALSMLPTKKGDEFSQSYYIVIAILLIGVAILFYLRKKMPQTPSAATPKNKQSSNWLFEQNRQESVPAKESKAPGSSKASEVTIRFQKPLDEKNSVVMLDFGSESYLVLMGNGNILLDKFHEDKPVSQQEFETILQERHEELESFLHGKKSHTDAKEALQSYKERAASLIYSDDA
jgi:hypothetical protein